MKVSLILVGTELLSGMTLDTNSVFMAEKLNEYSLEIVHKCAVRDDIDEIVSAIEYAKKSSDLIILSGGLGPTVDDITKDAIGKYLNLPLIVDEDEYLELKGKFERLNVKLANDNVKEVEKPLGAISFKNEVGLALPIFIDGIVAFPGVPRELYDTLPRFLSYYAKENGLETDMYLRDILVWGVPESHLDARLHKFFDHDEIHCEFLAKDYGIIVRLQCNGRFKTEADIIAEKIYSELGDSIYGEGEDRLEKLLVEELVDKGLSISTAESCSGGAVASKLIDIAGVSATFHEGIVCYSNQSKVDRLGVKEETLEKFGAVSEECALEMLDGLDTDIAISTTGIAGPDGGSREKPIGTVYVGIRVGNEKIVHRFNFRGTREKIRRYTVMNTLFKTIKMLKG